MNLFPSVFNGFSVVSAYTDHRRIQKGGEGGVRLPSPFIRIKGKTKREERKKKGRTLTFGNYS